MAFLRGDFHYHFLVFFGMSCLFKVFFSTLITLLLGLTLDDMIWRMSLPKFLFENSAVVFMREAWFFVSTKDKAIWRASETQENRDGKASFSRRILTICDKHRQGSSMSSSKRLLYGLVCYFTDLFKLSQNHMQSQRERGRYHEDIT